MKRSFSPVRNMVALTRRITAEDLSLRLDSIESHDEIGELAETLNDMIARLEHSFKQIQQFSGDAAHELKTPLAELKCNAEVALRRERSPEEYRHALENVVEDSEALQHIIDDLLILARLDDRQFRLNRSEFGLDELFLACFENYHSLAGEKQLSVTFEKMDAARVSGDRTLLTRLLSNLLMNAIKYTPQGGALTLAAYQKDGQALVRIADTGVGIDDEHLPYIFDRFYRVEQSRSHDTGGSGLGLAIVKKIVELHQGKISVQSRPKQGSTFQVSLPSIF